MNSISLKAVKVWIYMYDTYKNTYGQATVCKNMYYNKENTYKKVSRMLKDKLKQLRLDAGLSQKKAAELLDITNQTIQQWEKGASEPRASELIIMSEMYSVSIEEICRGVETDSNQALALKIRESEKLSEEDKKCVNAMLEAMIIRHRTREINFK